MKNTIFCVVLVLLLTVRVLPAGAQSPIITPTPEAGEGGDVSLPAAELSGTWLAAGVALLLSLALTYVPGFSAWWGAFALKREALAGAGFLMAWGLVGLHYMGALDLGLGAFGWPVVWQALDAWLKFAGVGQLAFTGQKLLSKGTGA